MGYEAHIAGLGDSPLGKRVQAPLIRQIKRLLLAQRHRAGDRPHRPELIAHAAESPASPPERPAARPASSRRHGATRRRDRAYPGARRAGHGHAGRAIPRRPRPRRARRRRPLFHPDLTHWETRTGYPALIGVVRDRDGEIIGLHRTYSREEADGQVAKAAVAKPRMMLGRVAGGAVRLGADRRGAPLGDLRRHRDRARGHDGAARTCRSGRHSRPPGSSRCELPPERDARHHPRRPRRLRRRSARRRGRRPPAARRRPRGRRSRCRRARATTSTTCCCARARGRRAGRSSALPRRRRPRRPPADRPASAAELRERRHGAADAARRRGRSRPRGRQAWSLLLASNRTPWLFRFAGIPTWVVPDDEGRPVAATLTEERLRHMLARLADWRRLNAKGELVPAPPPMAVVKSVLATPDPGAAGAARHRQHAGVRPERQAADQRPAITPTRGCSIGRPRASSVPPIPARPTPAEVAAARDADLRRSARRLPVRLAGRAGARRGAAAARLPARHDRRADAAAPDREADARHRRHADGRRDRHHPHRRRRERDDRGARRRGMAQARHRQAAPGPVHRADRQSAAASSTAPPSPPRSPRPSGRTASSAPPRWRGCRSAASGSPPATIPSSPTRWRGASCASGSMPTSSGPGSARGFRHPDLMTWVRANRARLVAACLTLCQAWIAAGRPRGDAHHRLLRELGAGHRRRARGRRHRRLPRQSRRDDGGVRQRGRRLERLRAGVVGPVRHAPRSAPAISTRLPRLRAALPLDGAPENPSIALGRAIGPMRDRIFDSESGTGADSEVRSCPRRRQVAAGREHGCFRAAVRRRLDRGRWGKGGCGKNTSTRLNTLKIRRGRGCGGCGGYDFNPKEIFEVSAYSV